MLPIVVPAVLAGVLGFLLHRTEEPAEYLPRLRLLFAGSAALGCVGILVFIWQKASGWKRVLHLPLALAAVRITYVPVLYAAVLGATWIDGLGRLLGVERPGLAVHCGLGVFISLLCGLASLGLVAAVAHLRRGAALAALAGYAGLGVLAFVYPEDRTPLPQRFAARDLPIAANSTTHLDVVDDDQRPARARVLAACGGVRHALMPRHGWAGVVRAELLGRFRWDPDLPLRERVTGLEGALVRARESLRTSPRTPPG